MIKLKATAQTLTAELRFTKTSAAEWAHGFSRFRSNKKPPVLFQTAPGGFCNVMSANGWPFRCRAAFFIPPLDGLQDKTRDLWETTGKRLLC